MITRKQVLLVIKRMPDSFEAAAFFDKVLLLSKTEEGRDDIKQGRFFSTTDAKKKLKKWLT